MNMPTTKALKVLIISTLSCVSLTGITGCDMLEKKETVTDKYKVKVPSTPPLQAGSSVSQSSIGSATHSQMEQQQVALEKTNQNIAKPAQPRSKPVSIVTSKVTAGTPEATLKTALDTVYFGEAKDAVQYYHIKDVPDFGKELQAAQQDIQANLESVTFQKTTFNESKTEAQIDFDIKYKGKTDVDKRSSLLKKMDGKWKIIG